MHRSCWEKNIFELIRRTSTDLPADVENAIKKALTKEKKNTHASWVLESILKNAAIAREKDIPLCQDTGALLFYYCVPVGFDTNALASFTRAAVSRATRYGYLRHNTIETISGAASPTNIGDGSPFFHFVQGARKTIDVRLIMKGGGCENVGIQYSLPELDLSAGRDFDGVYKCVLDAVWRAQGNGCAPGILGVCIGGDRASGYAHSKEQFLRKIGEKSAVRQLARLEEKILRDARSMNIGPMGLGGKAALLDVKIDSLSRLPASFFVTVSYMCWAMRRRGAILGTQGGVKNWLY